MNKKIFLHARVFSEGKILDDYGIQVEQNKITQVEPSDFFQKQDITNAIVFDVAGDFLVPGFLDMHMHGIFDLLVDNGREDIEKISAVLPQFGVTGFFPTVLPHAPKGEKEFLQDLGKARSTGAQILGFFCEGPFIARTGAIRPDALADKSVARLENMQSWLAPNRTIFAISPEIEDMKALIPKMGSPIFITHTAASVAQTEKAIELGARHATHFYDVFPLPGDPNEGARPVGAVEVILADSRTSVDFILDGEHVEPVVLRMAMACKPLTSISLISDSNVGAGFPPGTYHGIGSEEISFAYEGAPARGTENSLHPGCLYGSGLTLDRAVRNVLKFKVGSIEDALTMVSTSPAKVLGLIGNKGDIKVGFDADIVRLSEELEVKATWVLGEKRY